MTTEGSHGRITKPCQNIDSCELKPALKPCHFLNTRTLCTNTHVRFYDGLIAVFVHVYNYYSRYCLTFKSVRLISWHLRDRFVGLKMYWWAFSLLWKWLYGTSVEMIIWKIWTAWGRFPGWIMMLGRVKGPRTGQHQLTAAMLLVARIAFCPNTALCNVNNVQHTSSVFCGCFAINQQNLTFEWKWKMPHFYIVVNCRIGGWGLCEANFDNVRILKQ